jgi:hypothetical protein
MQGKVKGDVIFSQSDKSNIFLKLEFLCSHKRPTGQVRPNFLGQARAKPRLGQAARAFYSVK